MGYLRRGHGGARRGLLDAALVLLLVACGEGSAQRDDRLAGGLVFTSSDAGVGVGGASGAGGASSDPAGGGSAGSAVCRPQTCAEAAARCGSQSDGCGGTLFCGTCPGGSVCSADGRRCEEPSVVCARGSLS